MNVKIIWFPLLSNQKEFFFSNYKQSGEAGRYHRPNLMMFLAVVRHLGPNLMMLLAVVDHLRPNLMMSLAVVGHLGVVLMSRISEESIRKQINYMKPPS